MNYKTLKEITATEKAIQQALVQGVKPQELEKTMQVKFLVLSDGYGEIEKVEVIEFL